MRRRDHSTVTPEVAAELAALDAALAGGRVAPEHADLAELAVIVRDTRAQPTPEFARGLDERVATGFRAEARPQPSRGRPSRRMLMPALGTAAAAAAVIVALTSVDWGGSPTTSPDSVGGGQVGGRAPSAGATGTDQAAATRRVPEAADPSAADQLGSKAAVPAGALSVAPSLAGPAAGTGTRRVERAAELTLAPPPDAIDRVADGVVRVTDRFRGFVLRSSVGGDDSGRGRAEFDLRIPSAQLQPALAGLSKLAHVRARSESGFDVTARYNSAADRLREARAERLALLRALARATSANETASLRARLRDVSRRLGRSKRALRELQLRTSYSTVSVVVEPGKAASKGGGAWTPRDALRDAGRILEVALGVLLVALAIGLPLGALALVGLGFARGARRRAREHALDSA